MTEHSVLADITPNFGAKRVGSVKKETLLPFFVTAASPSQRKVSLW